MLLSSITKLSNYTGLGITPKAGGNDWLNNRRKLMNWQAALSNAIERYCHRKFIIPAASVVEDFNTGYRQVAYFPEYVPIVSIDSVQADMRGMYDGTSQYTITNDLYHKGLNGWSLVLIYPVVEAYNGLRLTYKGGIAYDAVKSVFAVSVSGTPLVSWYAVNDTGSAVGIVRAYSAGSLTLENVYGIFGVGDVLSFATTEEGLFDTTQQQAGVSATINSVTTQSLAEAYPDIERALEIEVRYMQKHQMDFENVSTMNDQTTRRQSTVFQTNILFQPETRQLLDRHVRPYI